MSNDFRIMIPQAQFAIKLGVKPLQVGSMHNFKDHNKLDSFVLTRIGYEVESSRCSVHLMIQILSD